MRVRRNLVLLTTACVWAVGAGCASKSAREPAAASADNACAKDLLHTASSSPDAKPDPRIESILTQPTGDARLVELNRRMYEALHALDVELRKEQRLAACERPALEARSDPAPASSQAATADGGGLGGSVAIAAASAGAGGASGAATSSSASGATPAAAAVQSAMTGSMARATGLRNTGRTASGGGGNGATAPKITPGSDNDIVARRLRKAAEQESNPTLRAKLWKEYTDYLHGTAAN